jgi:hypothetical protein
VAQVLSLKRRQLPCQRGFNQNTFITLLRVHTLALEHAPMPSGTFGRQSNVRPAGFCEKRLVVHFVLGTTSIVLASSFCLFGRGFGLISSFMLKGLSTRDKTFTVSVFPREGSGGGTGTVSCPLATRARRVITNSFAWFHNALDTDTCLFKYRASAANVQLTDWSFKGSQLHQAGLRVAVLNYGVNCKDTSHRVAGLGVIVEKKQGLR